MAANFDSVSATSLTAENKNFFLSYFNFFKDFFFKIDFE